MFSVHLRSRHSLQRMISAARWVRVTMMMARWVVVGAIGLSACLSWRISNAWAGGIPSGSHGGLPTWQVLVAAHAVPHLSQPQGLAIDQRGMGVNKWMYLVDTVKSRIV